MKKYFIFSLLAIAMCGCTSVKFNVPEKESRDNDVKVLNEVAMTHIAKGNAGILIGAIFPDGRETVIVRGVADVANRDNELSTNSIFRIGSLTKNLMLLLCEKLEKEKIVDFDKSVYDSFGERVKLNPIYKTVTLRDLMLHKSGLPREDYDWDDGFLVLDSLFNDGHIYREYATRDGLFKTLNSSDCVLAIKKHQMQYSNLGYGLLALAIEAQCGRDIATLFRDEVAIPLDLKDTTFNLSREQESRLVGSHSGDVPFFWLRNRKMRAHDLGEGMRGAGGLYSSGADQMKCLRLYREYFLSRDARNPYAGEGEEYVHVNHYLLKSPGGHRWLVRYGMTYGSAAFLGFDLTSGTAVLILRNNCDWPDDLGLNLLSVIEVYTR